MQKKTLPWTSVKYALNMYNLRWDDPHNQPLLSNTATKYKRCLACRQGPVEQRRGLRDLANHWRHRQDQPDHRALFNNNSQLLEAPPKLETARDPSLDRAWSNAIKLATSYTFHSQASSEEGLCQLSLLSQRHTQPQHSSADQALGDWPQICTSHYHPCPVIRTRPGTGTWNHKGRNLRNITPMVCIL